MHPRDSPHKNVESPCNKIKKFYNVNKYEDMSRENKIDLNNKLLKYDWAK